MENAFAWIGDIVGWFGRLIPRILIMRATHEGVAFVRGKNVKRLKPGLHWWWPFWTEVLMYPVKRQSLDLPPQTLTTSDGIPVTGSAVMIYEVYDIVAGLAQQWDLAETARDLGRTAMADIMCAYTFDAIRTERSSINEELKTACESELKEFGVKVLKVKLTDFAKTKVITIFNGGENTYVEDDEEEDE